MDEEGAIVVRCPKADNSDLNGHKLTCSGNNVQINGDVTIKGGTIGGYGLQIAGGTVALAGGIVTFLYRLLGE